MSDSAEIFNQHSVALNNAKTPAFVARMLKWLLFFCFFLPIVMLFFPWQQNITAAGNVTALSANERKQTIDAPITGLITKWHVQEGATVKKGELLLEMSDVDPNFKSRLTDQRNTLSEKLSAKNQELRAYETQLLNLNTILETKVTAAEYKLSMAKQKVRTSGENYLSSQATLDTANQQIQRLKRLFDEGLVSKRDLEIAERDHIIATRNVNSAQANLEAAKAEESASNIDIQQIRADAQSSINSNSATLNKIKSEIADSQNSLSSSEISLSRQNAKIVAPREGTVFRIPVNTQSEIVSQGQPLVVIVPKTQAKSVALYVDGLDAALILPDSKVRLEFEGWPALQVAGWPQVAIGTFGGKVAFVDSIDDGTGQFRVMVVPDEAVQKWPDDRFLRQGVKTKGWVLLNQVTVGYEIWRILNRFPPKLTLANNEKP
jgi:multidrug efflux pump subunit AcrA (membrane-fusion protein)